MMSHYVPVFSIRNPDGTYVAVCGEAVRTYTTEPLCEACQAWLQADADMLDSLTRWSKTQDREHAAARDRR